MATPTPREPGAPDRPMAVTYAKVIAVQVVVLAGLWLVQSYFGR